MYISKKSMNIMGNYIHDKVCDGLTDAFTICSWTVYVWGRISYYSRYSLGIWLFIHTGVT